MKRASVGILPVITVDRASSKPLYRRLYEGYREAILERRLRTGQRLPSTRSLAVELRISRIPVLNAFEQLLAEGYFESRVGSGTFVAAPLPRHRTIGRRAAAILQCFLWPDARASSSGTAVWTSTRSTPESTSSTRRRDRTFGRVASRAGPGRLLACRPGS